jgi:hypothetical protein
MPRRTLQAGERKLGKCSAEWRRLEDSDVAAGRKCRTAGQEMPGYEKSLLERERQCRDAKFAENAEDQLGGNTGARARAFVRE